MMLSLRRVTGPICLAFTGRPALEGGGERERDADDMAPRLGSRPWRESWRSYYKKIYGWKNSFCPFLVLSEYTSGYQEYR